MSSATGSWCRTTNSTPGTCAQRNRPWTYTCRDGIQTYRPEFTYMGFQYVAVTGMEVTEENLAAWDIYSDMEQIGDFSCSDERLNQFQKNIQTSLKANFVDIPQTVPRGMSAAAGPGTLPCLPRRQPSIWILPVS